MQRPKYQYIRDTEYSVTNRQEDPRAEDMFPPILGGCLFASPGYAELDPMNETNAGADAAFQSSFRIGG